MDRATEKAVPNPTVCPAANITVSVKFSGQTLDVSISPDATASDLKSLLQPLTNVIPRGQKLISKGKFLVDKESLKSQNISNGSKIMLMASQGLHQGDGPITKNVVHQAANLKKNADTKEHKASNTRTTIDRSRLERWKLTGVIALSDCNLKAVPEDVWSSGPSIRVLDASNNSIEELPAKVGLFKSLNRLLLNGNNIVSEKISWEGLSSLKSLTLLSLSQNNLTTLPPEVGTLASLCQLHIANNQLSSLPEEVGLLNRLQILKAGNNRIKTLPSSIGNCRDLIEMDLSCNLLCELPETVGNLHNLKALHIKNNGLKSLPSALFKKCSQLSTLDLHGTEITNDVLRQVEGWEDFDERRRSKHQKQLDFRAGSSGVFDEGADDDNSFR